MENIKRENVHISQIRIGDTIEQDGILRTVCSSNIKRCGFMGVSLFGDSYNSGNIPVIKVTFIVPTNKKLNVKV